MTWLEVSVRVNPEAAEAVAEVLSRYAPQGVAFDLGTDVDKVREVTVKAYMVVDDEIHTRRRQVEAALAHLSHIWSVIPEPAFREVVAQDWTAAWKEQIPVIHLGNRVVIKPSWRTYTAKENEIVLEMDPGMAFGSGLHPTTQLCIAALEDLVSPGMSVLDLGTGTGILAMVAARLGAHPILAIDNDRDAVVAARRNIRANQLSSEIAIRHGTHSDVAEAYDLVMANILTPVIVDMAESGLAERVQLGGALVASGILDTQTEEVAEALQRAGLRVTGRRHQDEWVALLAERPTFG
ncbi:MAG: 50S ribosomal protein L11 methyltransferase [Anaerolineae bacterium]